MCGLPTVALWTHSNFVTAMNRDTEELPLIMNELDECAQQVDEHLNKLTTSRKEYQQDLDHLLTVLDTLEGLGDIMSEMLLTQDSVEVSDHTFSQAQPLLTHDIDQMRREPDFSATAAGDPGSSSRALCTLPDSF